MLSTTAQTGFGGWLQPELGHIPCQGHSGMAEHPLAPPWHPPPAQPCSKPPSSPLLPRPDLYMADLSFLAGLRAPRGFSSPEMFLISISSCQETLLV